MIVLQRRRQVIVSAALLISAGVGFVLGAHGTTPAARQLNGLLTAALLAGLTAAGIVLVGLRRRNVSAVVTPAAIAQIDQALDRYAAIVPPPTPDPLGRTLRRQRREIEHVRALLDPLPDGVIAQTAAGEVLLINAAAHDWLSGDPGPVLALFSDDAMSDGGTTTAAPLTDLPPTPGVIPLGGEHLIAIGERTLAARQIALLAWSQQRVGRVIVLRDVTVAQRRAAAARAFAELSAPVSAADPLPPGVLRAAPQLQKVLAELRGLLGADDHAAPPPVRRHLTAEALLWTLVNDWRQTTTAADLRLDAAIAPGVSAGALVLWVDERRIRWAIGSVIDQAIKSTAAGGAVSIEIKAVVDGYVQFRVRDSGSTPEPPIAAGGTALVSGAIGLRSARAIVEQHGGRLEVRSKPGVGTAVSLWLPLTKTAPPDDRLPDDADETRRI